MIPQQQEEMSTLQASHTYLLPAAAIPQVTLVLLQGTTKQDLVSFKWEI